MTAIKNMLMGEDARRAMEGVSSREIIAIIQSESASAESSPFAKVLGFHMAAVPQSNNKGHNTSCRVRIKKKG